MFKQIHIFKTKYEKQNMCQQCSEDFLKVENNFPSNTPIWDREFLIMFSPKISLIEFVYFDNSATDPLSEDVMTLSLWSSKAIIYFN